MYDDSRTGGSKISVITWKDVADDNPPSRTQAFRTRGGGISFDDCFTFAQQLENELDAVTRDRDRLLDAVEVLNHRCAEAGLDDIYDGQPGWFGKLIKELEEARSG